MSIIRTAILSSLFGLSALPALADALTFDLPRLEFPSAPEATRADGMTATVPVRNGN